MVGDQNQNYPLERRLEGVGVYNAILAGRGGSKWVGSQKKRNVKFGHCSA